MPPELATSLVASETDRLGQAEALVRAYCGWHIAPSRADVTETVRALDSRTVLIPSMHVTGVTSVTDAGGIIADTDYEWSSSGILTRTVGSWTSGDITVAFTHGYDAAPAEVAGVVQAVAQRAVNNPGSVPQEQVGPFGSTNSQVGSGQAPALALLDAEKAAIDRYRLPSMP